MTITTKQYNSLVKTIYETLISVVVYTPDGEEIEMGLGEMGDCLDTATNTVNKWCNVEQITIID